MLDVFKRSKRERENIAQVGMAIRDGNWKLLVKRFRSSEYSYKSIRVSSPNQRPGMGTPMTASYFSSKRLRALTRTMP